MKSLESDLREADWHPENEHVGHVPEYAGFKKNEFALLAIFRFYVCFESVVMYSYSLSKPRICRCSCYDHSPRKIGEFRTSLRKMELIFIPPLLGLKTNKSRWFLFYQPTKGEISFHKNPDAFSHEPNEWVEFQTDTEECGKVQKFSWVGKLENMFFC